MTFKKASDSMQARARRSVVENRSNAGVDESAFKMPDERELHGKRHELVRRKKEVETKLLKVKSQIALANRRHTFGESGHHEGNAFNGALVYRDTKHC